MWFDSLVVVAAVAGGVIAAVAGFGIGSMLTPALALQVDARLAVAAVSIPHLIGTAFRFWLLGARVDRGVLKTFGLTSAAGGLAGALLQQRASTPALMVIFGALLLFTSGAELAGLTQRLRFRGIAGWIAGGVSGLLGGLVGNQGGIRSAALLGVQAPSSPAASARQDQKLIFVGTATAIGLMVDGARVPVYLWQLHQPLAGIGRWIAMATAGVLAGTSAGYWLLKWIPERWFRRVVALLLAALGVMMVWQGLGL